MDDQGHTAAWRTKPTDRFVLKWIKIHLCARITPRLLGLRWLQPWMITVGSSSLGLSAGLAFTLRLGWLAGILAAASQILDGVDGQYARLTGRQGSAGAMLDSVLDRYGETAIVIGLVIYLARLSTPIPAWVLLVLGFLALTGSLMVSFSSARAEILGIHLGKPTLASKGTRMTAVTLCALGSAVWPLLPIVGLVYLVLHPNLVVVSRLIRAFSQSSPSSGAKRQK
jgi:phosphatidylglycerophosphate synthase